LFSFAILFFCLIALPSRAEEADQIDDIIRGFDDELTESSSEPAEMIGILDGFDDDAADEAHRVQAAEEPSALALNGEAALTSTYSFHNDAASPWRNLTMLRSELDVTVKYEFSDKWRAQISTRGFYDLSYSLNSRAEYTAQVLDAYKHEVELRDTFVEGRLTDHLDIKIGRQIVVWGFLDHLSVTDAASRLDTRFPGLADMEDLRLPVAMGRIDYYFDHWHLTGLFIAEMRLGKMPVFGSDFLPASSPLPPEIVPDDGLEEAQYAVSLTGVFSGWDMALYWADTISDQTYIEPVSLVSPAQLVRKHPRIDMTGAATNVARGDWLLKGEAAWFDGLKYTNAPGTEFSRTDLGIGAEYAGFTNTTLSLEAAFRHIADYDPRLKMAPDETHENTFQWALRIHREFLNDTLALSLLVTAFGANAEEGAFERLDLEYDITDGMSIRAGILLYQSGNTGRLKNIGANDRLFAVLKYAF